MGPQGAKGEPADPAVSVVGWAADYENYRVLPRLLNGEVGPIIELRELFAQYQRETRED